MEAPLSSSFNSTDPQNSNIATQTSSELSSNVLITQNQASIHAPVELSITKSAASRLTDSDSIHSTRSTPLVHPEVSTGISALNGDQPESPSPPTPSHPPTSSSSSPSIEIPFDFQVFLDQMKSKSADPVSKYLRSFLNNFSKRPFSTNDQIKLIRDFLQFIGSRMRECDVWKNISETDFDNATEAMEKLVMNRLYDYTFTPRIDQTSRHVTTDDLERDQVLQQRIKLFNWVLPEHLDLTIGEGSQGFVSFARNELLKINHYKAPRDKLICTLNCAKVIFGLLRHQNTEENADAFMPFLVYVVLRSNPPNLLSNIEYICRFRDPTKLQGETGYYLSSLQGAVAFIENMDHTSLSSITQEQFEKNVELAIHSLSDSPLPDQPPVSRESPYSGEESASPLKLPTLGETLADDTKRFFQRTGETITKPMSLIGKILSEAFDGIDEPPGIAGRPNDPNRASSPIPIPTSYQPRVRPSSSSPTHLAPDLRTEWGSAQHPSTPSYLEPIHSLTQPRYSDNSASSPRGPSPMDFTAMQHEIDRAHEEASTAARETVLSIFPDVDPEIADIVLEATGGDVGLSIDKLLEMGVVQ